MEKDLSLRCLSCCTKKVSVLLNSLSHSNEGLVSLTTLFYLFDSFLRHCIHSCVHRFMNDFVTNLDLSPINPYPFCYFFVTNALRPSLSD